MLSEYTSFGVDDEDEEMEDEEEENGKRCGRNKEL